MDAPHPTLRRTFAALDRAKVNWCVLRGEGDLGSVTDDVDLLVSTADRATLAAVMIDANYLRLASWGRGSHDFFLTYDPNHDAWVKIDVVSALDFGPSGVMETGAAPECLRRRITVSGVRMLAPEDRFWALMLHCMLDRGEVPPHHADRLRGLARSIDPGGPLAAWFDAYSPPGWNAFRVIALAREGGWSSLVDMADVMRATSRWGSRRAITLHVARTVARRMTKLRRMVREPGISVALLGPDGAGKSTLARSLGQTFYFPVRSVYMGLYGAGSERGRPPRGMMGRLGRQWAGFARAEYHRHRGRLVVYDRFSYDAFLRHAQGSGLKARVRRWVLTHAVPGPDVTLLLDAPSEMLYARKREHDVAALESQRNAYLELASELGNIRVVRADRSPDEVRRHATTLVFNEYVSRTRRRATTRP